MLEGQKGLRIAYKTARQENSNGTGQGQCSKKVVKKSIMLFTTDHFKIISTFCQKHIIVNYCKKEYHFIIMCNKFCKST